MVPAERHHRIRTNNNNRLNKMIRKILVSTFWACTVSVIPHSLAPILQAVGSSYPFTVKFFIGDIAITTNVLGVLFTIVDITKVLKAVPYAVYDFLNTDCFVSYDFGDD